jgi:threonine/homoserine/homoserine lactone efflux protein
VSIHFWAFVGISFVVIVAPGPDTVLVTKNAVLHGLSAALGTSFTVLKLVGAAYLVFRPRVKAALDRLTGIVLIGLGIRLAFERR